MNLKKKRGVYSTNWVWRESTVVFTEDRPQGYSMKKKDTKKERKRGACNVVGGERERGRERMGTGVWVLNSL